MTYFYGRGAILITTNKSTARLDAASAVLFTPQEIVLNVAVFQVVVVVLGLDPLAAAVLGYITAFYGLFQHFNIRTP